MSRVHMGRCSCNACKWEYASATTGHPAEVEAKLTATVQQWTTTLTAH